MDHGKWINSFLCDLNDHTSQKSYTLSQIAANDRLFFSHSHDTLAETFAEQITVPHAAYLFDSTTFLISRLEVVSGDSSNASKSWNEYDPDCKRLKNERFIANLLHLLRRLQHVLFQILVHRSIKHVDELVSNWRDYWLQRKKLDDGWFTEWPSGERPLSTTWPWNIRPSLVILWGVCWMFYPQVQDSTQNNGQGDSALDTLGSEGFAESWVHNLCNSDYESTWKASSNESESPVAKLYVSTATGTQFDNSILAQPVYSHVVASPSPAIAGYLTGRGTSASAAPQALAINTNQDFVSPSPYGMTHNPVCRLRIQTSLTSHQSCSVSVRANIPRQ